MLQDLMSIPEVANENDATDQDYSSKILPLVLQEGIYYIDKKASITMTRRHLLH